MQLRRALNQNFNAVITSSGRAVAFPNIYQHQVKPFSLADKTKPGHRKILAFFLVDPDKRIPSTANVAPQQREWIEHELCKPRIASPENALPALPVEVWAQIVDMADLMTFEDAKKVRLELMEERKSAVRRNDEYTFE